MSVRSSLILVIPPKHSRYRNILQPYDRSKPTVAAAISRLPPLRWLAAVMGTLNDRGWRNDVVMGYFAIFGSFWG